MTYNSNTRHTVSHTSEHWISTIAYSSIGMLIIIYRRWYKTRCDYCSPMPGSSTNSKPEREKETRTQLVAATGTARTANYTTLHSTPTAAHYLISRCGEWRRGPRGDSTKSRGKRGAHHTRRRYGQSQTEHPLLTHCSTSRGDSKRKRVKCFFFLSFFF